MMNDKKICFIVTKTAEREYEECLLYLQELTMPVDFSVEILTFTDRDYPAADYNRAMNSSDAKYKIYLKDKIRVIQRDCLVNMLNIFQKNKKIGMLGIMGVQKCPVSGDWWTTRRQYGKSYAVENGKNILLEFNSFAESYQTVEIVPDIMLMTQYDIEWRSDLFRDSYFYDFAQCVEFKRNNYQVAVVQADRPWCIFAVELGSVLHESAAPNTCYDQAKDAFLDEYSKDLFPLVSVWVPTHNRPVYAKVALGCVLAQSYRNVEICMSDNSDNEDTFDFMQAYGDDPRVKYFRFYPDRKDSERDECVQAYVKKNFLPYSSYKPELLPILSNWIMAWQMAAGEYLSLLCDDDWIHPSKIERVMQYYLDYDDVSLVTSYRHLLNGDGELCDPIMATCKLCETDSIYEGADMAREMLLHGVNFIGENAVYHRKYAKSTMMYGYYNGNLYSVNTDMAAWLELFRQGRLVYLVDGLSGFRLSGDNGQCQLSIVCLGHVDLIRFVYDSYQNQLFLHDKEAVAGFCKKWLVWVANLWLDLEQDESVDKRPLLQWIDKAQAFIDDFEAAEHGGESC